MTTQAALWTAAGGFAGLAGIAFAVDHRRTRRRDLDRVGWMPWNLIQVFAMICGATAAAVALQL